MGLGLLGRLLLLGLVRAGVRRRGLLRGLLPVFFLSGSIPGQVQERVQVRFGRVELDSGPEPDVRRAERREHAHRVGQRATVREAVGVGAHIAHARHGSPGRGNTRGLLSRDEGPSVIHGARCGKDADVPSGSRSLRIEGDLHGAADAAERPAIQFRRHALARCQFEREPFASDPAAFELRAALSLRARVSRHFAPRIPRQGPLIRRDAAPASRAVTINTKASPEGEAFVLDGVFRPNPTRGPDSSSRR